MNPRHSPQLYHAFTSDLPLLRSGHCTKLKPEYEAASEQLKGVAKLVAVDATAAQGLAQQFGIEGFPTIKVFPKGKKNVKKFEDYNVRPTRLTGPRSLRCVCLATIWALRSQRSGLRFATTVSDTSAGPTCHVCTHSCCQR